MFVSVLVSSPALVISCHSGLTAMIDPNVGVSDEGKWRYLNLKKAGQTDRCVCYSRSKRDDCPSSLSKKYYLSGDVPFVRLCLENFYFSCFSSICISSI